MWLQTFCYSLVKAICSTERFTVNTTHTGIIIALPVEFTENVVLLAVSLEPFAWSLF